MFAKQWWFLPYLCNFRIWFKVDRNWRDRVDFIHEPAIQLPIYCVFLLWISVIMNLHLTFFKWHKVSSSTASLDVMKNKFIPSCLICQDQFLIHFVSSCWDFFFLLTLFILSTFPFSLFFLYFFSDQNKTEHANDEIAEKFWSH